MQKSKIRKLKFENDKKNKNIIYSINMNYLNFKGENHGH